MIEIVACVGSEAGDEVAFNNLRSLEFHNLPSLRAFHLGYCIIKFPSLDDVIVVHYPNMKNFSTVVMRTPKLKYIYLAKEQMVPADDEYDHLNYHEFTQEQQLWDGDLNATIKQV